MDEKTQKIVKLVYDVLKKLTVEKWICADNKCVLVNEKFVVSIRESKNFYSVKIFLKDNVTLYIDVDKEGNIISVDAWR